MRALALKINPHRSGSARSKARADWVAGPRSGKVGSGLKILQGRKSFGGQVAQLVEQWTENPRVGGSIPPLATTWFLIKSASYG